MLTHGNRASWLNTIWDALEKMTPENDDEWNDICTAMAWVAEELDVEQEDL
jgi:hypothetical protein